MGGSARAPHASYSLNEGARLRRLGDRMWSTQASYAGLGTMFAASRTLRVLIFGATRHFEHQKSQFSACAPLWSFLVTEFDAFSVLLGAVVGAGFGGGVAWMVLRAGAVGTQREAARAATALLEKADAEAKAKAKDLELAAERKIAKRRESLDADVERQQQELRELEGRLDRRAEKLDVRSEEVAKQEAQAAALVGQRASALEEVLNQRNMLVDSRNEFLTLL